MYHVGIEKIRRAVEEANEQKKVAAKQRDRVAPKMGRMDVDYQVLHDAFFKWQTKPPLSGPGADSVLLTMSRRWRLLMLRPKMPSRLEVCSAVWLVVSACNQSIDTDAMRERSVHRGARMARTLAESAIWTAIAAPSSIAQEPGIAV